MSLLIKPEPFGQDMDRMFGRLFDVAAGNASAQRWIPAMDLVEAEDHFILEADLPGLGEDDVAIEVQDNTLTVSGERRAEHERSESGWYRLERTAGAFSRSLTLPDGVDADAVSAEFDRGVLTVRIPKPEERKPRRIAIKPENGSTPKAVEGSAEEK